MDNNIIILSRVTADTILDRVNRDCDTSLRTIITEEISFVLERIAKSAGWTEWPVHSD